MSGLSGLEIAQALIRCPSVTPEEGGALDYLESILSPAGFDCHRLPFADGGPPEVDNLFARLGSGAPHLCFAGHTDVVPPGDESLWSHPPFGGAVADGRLYGRGACDMKGGVACFAAAALAVAASADGALPGSISFLITGDEEGPAVNGTVKVLDWMAANGHVPDHCLLGEPSNPDTIGDAIKVGRRGSLNAALTVKGKQGHVAYPDRTHNPVPGLMAVIQHLMAAPLDDGSEHFAPSNLEVTTLEVDNPALNVVPSQARANLNIRFNDLHSAESLEAMVRETVEAALADSGLDHDIAFESNAASFLTPPGELTQILSDIVEEMTGRVPELSTKGGTSDARFIKDHCPVIEFGLVNATIHGIDENVAVADIELVTAIFERFIRRYFETFAA